MEGPLVRYPHNVFPSSVTGLPGHPAEDIVLDSIEIVYEGGASKDTAYFNPDSLTSITENEHGYPEFSMFGELPAWGFYSRHVRGLTMKNITIRYQKQDFRPAMIFDDVTGLQLQKNNIASGKTIPVMILNNTKIFSMKDNRLPFQHKQAIKITHQN